VIYCINPWCKSRENDDHAETCSACRSPLLINGRFKVLKTLYSLTRNHDVDIYEALDTTGSYETRGVNTIKILKVLKAFDERFIEIFRQEAKILQSLDHPAIPFVDIEDFFCIHLEQGPDDLYCLVMSKIEGVTLSDWVKEHGPISQELGITWLQQMSEILDYVHSHGFIHRDIKPDNIIVRPDTTLALIDFGFSQSSTDSVPVRSSSSRVSVYTVRSFGYTAPEQNIGRSYPQSDIYALGRTLIFALTGKTFAEMPSDEESGNLLWQDHAKQVSKSFRRFLDQLTSKSVAKRPQDAYEILCFLKDVLPEQIRWSRLWRSKPLRYGVIFVLAILLILLLDLSRHGLSNYYYDLGTNQANNADYTTARQSLHRSTWFNKNEPAYRALALMCDHIGDLNCAEDNYKAATQVNPMDDSPWYNLAIFYEDQGNLKKAMSTYQKALELKKNDPSLLDSIGRLYIRQGDYSKAEAKIVLAQNSLKFFQKEVNLTLLAKIKKNQAWIYLKQKRYQKAKKTLTEAVSNNSNLVSVYCLLAQVNEAINLPAEEDWEKCMFPNDNNIKNPQDDLLPEVSEWRHLRFNRTSLGKEKK
jgi:serine/threonine protein kinase